MDSLPPELLDITEIANIVCIERQGMSLQPEPRWRLRKPNESIQGQITAPQPVLAGTPANTDLRL